MVAVSRGWQVGQKEVPRPPTIVRSRGVPQVGHGPLPPRP